MIEENTRSAKRKINMSHCIYYAYWGDHNVNPHPHLHDQLEIYISLNNIGDFFLQEKRYPLSVGSLFLIRPFEIHHGLCGTNEMTNRYAIRFPLEILKQLSTSNTDLESLFQTAPHSIQLTHQELAQISGLMEILLQASPDTFGQDIQQNLLLFQFILVLARILHARGPVRHPVSEEHNSLVQQILQYIHGHYREEISLEDLSGHLYVSKSRLCKVFREHTGFTIGNYLTMYRLQTACSLLEKGEKVKEVGKAVGFRTYTHFIRTFTCKLGQSPKKFIKAHT